jgi:hypothetical protein
MSKETKWCECGHRKGIHRNAGHRKGKFSRTDCKLSKCKCIEFKEK